MAQQFRRIAPRGMPLKSADEEIEETADEERGEERGKGEGIVGVTADKCSPTASNSTDSMDMYMPNQCRVRPRGLASVD